MNNEFFNFDAVIEIEKKISYNQALEDLVKVMKERADDYSSIPNMFDIGYYQAYEHMCHEAERLRK